MIHLNNLMDKLAQKIHKTKSTSTEKKCDKIQRLLIVTTLIKIEKVKTLPTTEAKIILHGKHKTVSKMQERGVVLPFVCCNSTFSWWF